MSSESAGRWKDNQTGGATLEDRQVVIVNGTTLEVGEIDGTTLKSAPEVSLEKPQEAEPRQIIFNIVYVRTSVLLQ